MVGKSLGPYNILDQIGAGGMGEVYLAEDTRLGRRVAIKVLPEEFAADPERLARFEQEARAAAAINHPNIAVVHDIGFEPGDPVGTHFIVQEYLEGHSLRELLDKGPLPLDKALLYGSEVADALIAAHGAGIIHRDLKPGNIFVTDIGHAKVLDFGLAKLTEQAGPGKDLSMSPTMLGTVAGQVMGTAGYMAPEQVHGDTDIDGRADVFAFGCVLYEMVCGSRAFGGETALDTLHAIARTEPQSIGEIRDGLPTELSRIVRKCLAKDPARRYQGAGDLAVDLRALAAAVEAGTAPIEGAGSATGVAGGGTAADAPAGIGAAPVAAAEANAAMRWAPWVAAASFALVSAYLWFGAADAPATNTPTYLELAVPGATRDGNTRINFVDISANGRKIVVDTGNHPFTLFDLDRPGGAVAVPGTEDASLPRLSADGETLVYASDGLLQRRRLAGGTPEVIVRPRANNLFGISLTSDDRILYVPDWQDTVTAVAAAPDSAEETLLELDPDLDEIGHAEPYLLPDGRILYTSWAERWFLAVADLEAGSRTVLLPNGHGAVYTPTGHLLYAESNFLFARTLDLENLALGEPVTILDDLSFFSGTGRANFDVSDTGVLTYLTGAKDPDRMMLKIWPDGRREPLRDEPVPFGGSVHFSPAGDQLVMNLEDPVGGLEVWLYDFATDRLVPIAQDPGWDEDPQWSADSSSIVWSTETLGPADILIRPADRSGAARPLFVDPDRKYVADAHASGKYLVRVITQDDALLRDLWVYDEADPENPDRSLSLPGTQRSGSFSPDARYIVYESDDTGIEEIYVRPYTPRATGGEGIEQISRNGGVLPRWPTPERIFYRNGTQAMAVDVTYSGGAPSFSEPIFLFDGLDAGWDVAPDGSYFVTAELIEPPRLMVVFNWFEVLEQLAPHER